MKNGYVYILFNKRNGTLYTGVTSDLQKRVYEHKNKLIDGFTKKYNVDKLFYNYSKSTFENAEEKQQELALTQINDLKWYNKIWKLIKKFFRK